MRLVPLLPIVLLGLVGLVVGAPPEQRFTPVEIAAAEKEALSVLKANCLKCHGTGKVRGGLRLTSRESVLKGGDTGPAVDLKSPDASLLLQAIHYRDDLKMPPTGRLPANEVAILERWVRAGAPWPAASGLASPQTLGKDYWAYQPVQRPAVPRVRNVGWVRNPIDAFVLAKLEEQGLSPAPEADRVTLIRRAYFDLLGLPPPPAEVDAFVHDPAPDAWERLIDRLLASPHYGEKWGRHWLDLVRYAETNGYERDGPKPYAWRYRDYVIRSFNQDKPYDRFAIEQLAGDELPGYHPDAVIATGYYRLGLWDDEPADPLLARFNELDDIVATTAQVFLAMTMNCARCHDHKIDPIPQADYYRLLAFFTDVPHFSDSRDPRSAANLTDISPPAVRKTYEATLKQRAARLAELKAAMKRIEDAAIRQMPAEDQRAAEGVDRPQVVLKVPQYLDPKRKAEYLRLRAELAAVKWLPDPGRELALSVNHCLVRPPQTHVMLRGNAHAEGTAVEPGFPTVFGLKAPTIPPPQPGARSSGRRSVLAVWIASPANPLTARVMVNRIWQHHFGRGIVPSSNDFGKFGEKPTHPKLLDWLASEFVKEGWHLKPLHRLLMTSSAYRMSSKGNAAGLKADPANALFWRFNLRRLTAEEVRDSMLAVSGQLNPKMGGPSVYPPIPKEVKAGQSRPGEGWGKSPPEEANRRSVYAYVKRSLLVPILETHDEADTDISCPVRYTTTVPTQALGLLNGAFAQEQASAFAERLRREAPTNVADQVRWALRLATARVPSADEVAQDVAFIGRLRSKYGLSVAEALKQYCLLVLNTNEFVYVD